MDDSETGRTRFALLRSVIAIGGISLVALVVSYLSWGVGQAREAARRSQCLGHFKQLELALHNYHEIYGSFPPAVTKGPDGRAWHSWRVLILPLLEEKPLYDRYRFDEPWNGPHNQLLAAEFPSLRNFRCPSEGAGDSCSYFAVTGQRTLWPPGGSLTLDPEDLPDGSSNTLHLVEVSESGVHWMEPRDLSVDRMNFCDQPGHWRRDPQQSPGGSEHFIRRRTSRNTPRRNSGEQVRAMLLRDDGGPKEVP